MEGNEAGRLWPGWMWLVLLTAAALRLWQLSSAPPGLTHDEADHGLTAWRILQGQRQIYFTIGLGREPLYDYVTAGLMRLIGSTFLAGRLAAVYASLLGVAALAAWGRLALGRRAGLLAAAGLAVGFWPVMTARQALRSTLLPPLFTLAALLFWLGVAATRRRAAAGGGRQFRPACLFLLAGLCLGLTFYTYIPARALWLAFPLLLGYWWLTDRPRWRAAWRGGLLQLGTAGLVGAPLFRFLAAHPEVEQRVQELSAPLAALRQGDWQPLLTNAAGSLRLLTGAGDVAWRYNIPGRPWLNAGLGVLFYLGLLLAAAWILRPRRFAGAGGAFFGLAWLGLGLAPVLVTGPDAATTQAIGAQPALYLPVAMALAAVTRLLRRRVPSPARLAGPAVVLLLFGATAVGTARAYFGAGAQAPAVRVQYESTMRAMLAYVADHPAAAAAISTITPGPEHSPAVALLTLPDPGGLRWFDGRSALLLPGVTESLVLFPGFAPPAPALAPLWRPATLVETLPLRPTDEDRPVLVYRAESAAVQAAWRQALPLPAGLAEPVLVGPGLRFRGYAVQPAAGGPAGAVLEVLTRWEVVQPAAAVTLFTHLWAGAGAPVAQADRLDVSPAAWQTGDQFVQLHRLVVPAETAAGRYLLLAGAYDPATGRRLAVTAAGRSAGDTVPLQAWTVSP